MSLAIKGIFENGKITLLEPVPEIERAEVEIEFKKVLKKSKMRFGGLEGKIIIDDSFNDPLDDFKNYM